jgi:hypothetical protein
MNHYAGIDVSLEDSCICVIDANGKVVREGKISSEPTALIAWLSAVGVTLTRIGLMRQAGLAVELLEKGLRVFRFSTGSAARSNAMISLFGSPAMRSSTPRGAVKLKSPLN